MSLITVRRLKLNANLANMHIAPLFVFAFTAIIHAHTFGQVADSSAVFRELQKGDSLLFEEGFNKCDVTALEKIVSADFEFYHDQNGAQDRATFLKGFKESICSNPSFKPIRKLVKGSLVVYPLKNEGKVYGAIQTGIHDFYIAEPGKELRFTENAKFIATWVLDKGEWKVKRELSYDHNKPKRYGAKFDDHYAFPLFDTDEDIQLLLKELKIPSVSIGFIDDGRLQQIRAFGEQKKGQPVTYRSIYKVASLTKLVTAVITLKLVNNGTLQLDEPLYKYYIDADVKDNTHLKKLTVRHVLSHQSGFPNWRYLTETRKLTFEFEPGTRWQYSGEGMEYLRKALENKYKKPLEVLAEELLFGPLQMRNTHFYWDEDMHEKDYAVEHDANGRPMDFKKHKQANAAANLLTSVEDFGNFMAYVINGAGLSKKLYEEFITKQSNAKPGIDWGLGVQLLYDLEGSEFALQHTGGDDGVKAIVILLPKSKKGLVVFSNSENGMLIWKKILSEYFGKAGEEIVRRNIE